VGTDGISERLEVGIERSVQRVRSLEDSIRVRFDKYRDDGSARGGTKERFS